MKPIEAGALILLGVFLFGLAIAAPGFDVWSGGPIR